MMKCLSLLSILCCFSFSATQSLPKITGKYGKIETGEYICLELFEDQTFSMSISACDKDTYINGDYRHDKEAVYLTSEQQPGIKILDVQSKATETGKTIIELESPDALLIPEIKVRINETGKWLKPNRKRQIIVEEAVEKVELSLKDMTVSKTFHSAEAQEHRIKFAFEHLHNMTMNRQKWLRNGKKLVFKDEAGTQITLKRSRKCWFDYEFKDQ